MLKSYFFLLSFSTLLFTTHIKAIVIIVHGSFAAKSDWYKPGGNFYKELELAAKLLNQKVTYFSWSGLPTEIEIIKGAEGLAKTILNYPENEEIIVIGHSHGGNVINFASQLLSDPIERLKDNKEKMHFLSECDEILQQTWEDDNVDS